VINQDKDSTICAIATPSGVGAIAVIRLSGKNAISITDKLFVSASGKHVLLNAKTHSLKFGKFVFENKVIDEVLVSVFRNPNSYTGEDTTEISCHGSQFIQQKILEVLTQNGCRFAQAGEFTLRAFLNGKLDLTQAEAVADIIASENESQLKLAMQQMRGGYSEQIEKLRQELIDFTALMELELDFSEEDVEFADRKKFISLINHTLSVIEKLVESFTLGNAIKKGIPVAIAGKPNVGKSTLLNKLLKEEKAIVSDIAGTTRDFIEDTLSVNGITYRFIDTAGLRHTADVLEAKGIERSYEKIKHASLLLFMADVNDDYKTIAADVKKLPVEAAQKIIVVLNKVDTFYNTCNAHDVEEAVATLTGLPAIAISAKNSNDAEKLLSLIEKTMIVQLPSNDFVVTNARHVDALATAGKALQQVKDGLEKKLSGDLVSIDIRTALQALGTITGKITNNDILGSIFTRFCIGK